MDTTESPSRWGPIGDWLPFFFPEIELKVSMSFSRFGLFSYVPSAQADGRMFCAGGKFNRDGALFSGQHGDIILAVIGRKNSLACGRIHECELGQQRRN